MFCSNCAGNLKAVDEILSQDLQGGDYYTHFCKKCDTYWHLHMAGDEVVLISTNTKQFIASRKIIDDLKIELSERVFRMV